MGSNVLRLPIVKPSAHKIERFPQELLQVGGLLGSMVNLMIDTARSPQPILALASSLCSIGAVAGRKYQTETGLRTNLYVIGIADSGGGKDHARKVIKLALSKAGLANYLGGEEIASGPGLLAALKYSPSRVFLIDEIGKFLRVINGARAAGHKIEIWTNLTKLYSSADAVYLGSEYGDQELRPRHDINQPCCCVYGVTVPGTFWSALENGAMTDGSLARFLLFCVEVNYPPRNKRAGKIIIPDDMVSALQAVAAGVPGEVGNLAMVSNAEPSPYTVPSTPDAGVLLDRLDDDQTAWLKAKEGTPDTAVVARYWEHVAKVALIRAISDCPASPQITTEHVRWSDTLIRWCLGGMLRDASRYVAENETEAKVKRVLNIIRKAEERGLASSDITNKTDWLKQRERQEILVTLIEKGAIYTSEVKTEGRPAKRYTIRSDWQE